MIKIVKSCEVEAVAPILKPDGKYALGMGKGMYWGGFESENEAEKDNEAMIKIEQKGAYWLVSDDDVTLRQYATELEAAIFVDGWAECFDFFRAKMIGNEIIKMEHGDEITYYAPTTVKKRE